VLSISKTPTFELITTCTDSFEIGHRNIIMDNTTDKAPANIPNKTEGTILVLTKAVIIIIKQHSNTINNANPTIIIV